LGGESFSTLKSSWSNGAALANYSSGSLSSISSYCLSSPSSPFSPFILSSPSSPSYSELYGSFKPYSLLYYIDLIL